MQSWSCNLPIGCVHFANGRHPNLHMFCMAAFCASQLSRARCQSRKLPHATYLCTCSEHATWFLRHLYHSGNLDAYQRFLMGVKRISSYAYLLQLPARSLDLLYSTSTSLHRPASFYKCQLNQCTRVGLYFSIQSCILMRSETASINADPEVLSLHRSQYVVS